MNAVAAAVLLSLVATCTGTSVVSSGSQVLYTPSAYQYVSPYQYQQYQYVQPVVSSSSLVSHSVPVNYASSAVIPSTNVVGYPYAYNYGYGLSGLSLLKK